MAKGASVSASLSASEGLRYSLNGYGSGFKRASLELVRRMDTGTSLTHGFKRVTVREKLGRYGPAKAYNQHGKPREDLKSRY